MKKKNPVVSLTDYRKKKEKQHSQRTGQAASDSEFFPLDDGRPQASSVYYMSNYLKTKKEPPVDKGEGKILDFSAHKPMGNSPPSRFRFNAKEPISLTDYRKSKQGRQQVLSRARSWGQPAAVVALAMLLAFGVFFQKQEEASRGLASGKDPQGQAPILGERPPTSKYEGH